jgi:hypothetical protein
MWHGSYRFLKLLDALVDCDIPQHVMSPLSFTSQEKKKAGTLHDTNGANKKSAYASKLESLLLLGAVG